jgi:ammonia channel protein AmtB
VFWAAFLLFSWTAASIVSGACIERIKSGAFWILAVLIGSVTWIIDAAWGWHPDGWMVQLLGYHDAYASGVIHAIGGGFALGVVVNLGPRIGKFRPDGTPRDIPPHSIVFATMGLFLILAGFWGFYVACNVPIFDVQAGDGVFFSATNIYLGPTTLGAITFNFIMSMSGGFMGGYWVSKGDPFWTYSGYLAGIIAASAGNDLYTPIQAFLIGIVGSIWAYKLHYFMERKFKIDDPVGACAVHGYTGWLGVVIAGFLLWGYPSSPNTEYARVSPWGNFIGAWIMWGVLGFLPAYVVSKILKSFGLLRVPMRIELMGLDFKEDLDRDVAVAEVLAAERAEARAAKLIAAEPEPQS